MPQKSAILELQDMTRASNTSVAELLRHAKVIASNLKLDEFEAWIDREKNGYPTAQNLPDYRNVPSQLRVVNLVHGSVPVDLGVNNPVAAHFAAAPFPHAISTICQMAASFTSGAVDADLTPEELEFLVELDPEIQRRRPFKRMSAASISAIPEAVRDKLLDWTVVLVKNGVLGEGMVFTQQDRQIASSMTINNFGHTIHGNHGSIAHAENSPGSSVTAATGDAQLRQHIKMSIARTAKREEELSDALQRLADAVNRSRDLPEEKKSEATQQLAYVAEQCSLPADRRPPPTVLKPIVKGLRETLGVSADVLQVWPVVGPIICAALGIVL
ncbi:hypothetical protein FJV41_23965 [Myxococcus llanfairpwllgwyngyllgogerychwyrndrobwllllantysiliogogogochensis]|uniref:AbiTii domain-containing protein n=1 Tax=Myxococcus llanfairpwllgwyngyllgogerychwyrndrobwllllantysiliogogogochensis TaxID=2590453 RepID=A0A540WWS1_9BACT|nr:hypothetical protein [Myxococcus llanfairpwllgwyngyllgogerychwyrndrobwllllantysiliogogogochensis]TQF13449.1 hypothetical protein FJV41_23965 [Myxococcus llanfairpwllgwyngyllgogerychwyrndrobwllllantysiliogogogochensis]